MARDHKSIITIAIIILITISMFYSGYIPKERYINKQIEAFNAIGQSQSPPLGYIQPQVVEGFSEKPLEGAVIVIPEIAGRFVTNAQGYTETIAVPVIPDSNFESLHPKPWGELTLIVYKEGYSEYILFHTHVWEKQERKGPKILMFPKEQAGQSEPMSFVEAPHSLWVIDLVEKYRP